MSIYEITVEGMNHEKVLLEKYKGKVMLIVNTATKCMFTPQYDLLQYLYTKYEDQGLVILDFPCDQFFHQAPGGIKDIDGFCVQKYNTSFPRFEKILVNGPDEAMLYTYLKSKKKDRFSSKIKWNFTKFLVDKKGNVFKRYRPSVKPTKIEEDIKRLLKE